jgi:hypothetical protein
LVSAVSALYSTGSSLVPFPFISVISPPSLANIRWTGAAGHLPL